MKHFKVKDEYIQEGIDYYLLNPIENYNNYDKYINDAGFLAHSAKWVKDRVRVNLGLFHEYVTTDKSFREIGKSLNPPISGQAVRMRVNKMARRFKYFISLRR